MLVGFLTTATRDCILGRFQLHDHAGKTLRERVVNVSSHSVAFSQDGGALALLGKFVELNCKHRLVSERLRQFDLLRSIGSPSPMTNSDESFNIPADQGWDPQKF